MNEFIWITIGKIVVYGWLLVAAAATVFLICEKFLKCPRCDDRYFKATNGKEKIQGESND